MRERHAEKREAKEAKASFSKGFTPSMNIKRLVIKEIVVPDGRRECNGQRVTDLAESMALIGLKTPITVRIKKNEKYELVTGLHRLSAAKLLGWTTIETFVMDGDKADAKLWEIAENLFDNSLTALERAEHIAEWVTLVEKSKKLDDVPGRRGRPKGGIAEAARKLKLKGKSEEARRKSVSRSLQIAKISSRAKQAAKAAKLDDNWSALHAIAKEKTSRAQVRKAKKLAEAKQISSGPKSNASKKRTALKRESTPFDRLRNLANAWKAADLALRRPFVIASIMRDPEFADIRKAFRD